MQRGNASRSSWSSYDRKAPDPFTRESTATACHSHVSLFRFPPAFVVFRGLAREEEGERVDLHVQRIPHHLTLPLFCSLASVESPFFIISHSHHVIMFYVRRRIQRPLVVCPQTQASDPRLSSSSSRVPVIPRPLAFACTRTHAHTRWQSCTSSVELARDAGAHVCSRRLRKQAFHAGDPCFSLAEASWSKK